MNKLILTISFGLALVAAAPIVEAQQVISAAAYSGVPSKYFCGPGATNAGLAGPTASSNVAWFVSTVRGDGVPRLLSISFVSDIVGNTLSLYTSTNCVAPTNNGISGTNQLWLDSSGFASNDVVVIRYVNQDQYQRVTVTNWSAGQIGIHPATANAITTSDNVYKMTAVNSGVFTQTPGTTTNVQSIVGIATGRYGFPCLYEIGYSNAGSIKNAFGDFQK